MQRPLDRRCCPHCCRHPEALHQPAIDESHTETSASTVRSTTAATDVGESDEDVVELDSDAWHSAEDYQDQAAMSEGSSEHWDDEQEDEGNGHNEDDKDGGVGDGVDRDNGQDTQKLIGNGPVDASQVLEGTSTSVHASPIASLSTVLRSLDVRTTDTADDAQEGEGDVMKSPSRGTRE
ncbi:hypothetical protein LTR24_009307 [Lithohypha guttulata]|uniref:Uncharacterized protein n=1 Tax=Lithohypha guttulata TaxID=1690604 RepID=A0ABR0JXC2_9EURO|nr:hypothetical protein LTR24_009307 [Lithohypha guttulata]